MKYTFALLIEVGGVGCCVICHTSACGMNVGAHKNKFGSVTMLVCAMPIETMCSEQLNTYLVFVFLLLVGRRMLFNINKNYDANGVVGVVVIHVLLVLMFVQDSSIESSITI